jgi:hypothetical protein
MRIGINPNGNPIQKYIASVVKLSMGKNILWIKSMIKHNKLNIEYDLATREERIEVLRMFRSIIEIMNRVCGDDWEMYPIHLGNGKFQLYPVIRHKKFTIKNSDEDEHVIRELYSVLAFTPEINGDGKATMLGATLKGTRGSLQQKEKSSGYMHSHLNTTYTDSGNIYTVQDFCLGSGDVTGCLTMLQNEYSAEEFELMLHTWMTTVKWESLEGVPYIEFRNLTSPAPAPTRMASLQQMRNFSKDLIDYVKHTDEYTPTLVYQNGLLKVVSDKKLEKRLQDVLISSSSYSYLVKKAPNGQFVLYNPSTNGTVEILESNREIYFSGEKIPYQVYPDTTEYSSADKIEEFKPHPKLIEYVSEKIQHLILHAQIIYKRDCAKYGS